MSARDQGDGQNRRAEHAGSLARKLCVLCAVLCACDDDTPAVDAGPCVDQAHDEDLDGVGDKCDICPTVFDPAQPDTTELALQQFADGIGDACDLRPGRAGDLLGAFHPFVDPAAANAWTGSGWTIENDVARATTAARWVSRQQEPGDGIMAQARISALVWTAMPAAIEVVVDGDGESTGYGCSIVPDRDADGFDEIELRELGIAPTTKTLGELATVPLTITIWRIIDVQRRGTMICQVRIGARVVELEGPTTDDSAVGLYTLAASGATVDASSLIVYTTPRLPQGN